ncbi:MAG: molybdopterin molybdotransferase MoeA [Ignavibacteriae bacterium]|nr:molybdopterin molybdotransferase MoeA [Ignavibacteriota bacterium]
MISTQEARDIISAFVHPLGTLTVSFENSLGFVLAEDIISEENIPSFDNSAMDGFAVRSEDCKTVPTVLQVIDEISAGSVSTRRMGQGECATIMTGAKIPEDCDAVIQHEWTEAINEREIKLLRSVVPGYNIRRAGDDIRNGTTVLEWGQNIRPQEIGVLASLGRRFVTVFRKPTVAILATGNELVEIHKPLSNGKIRNSNLYTLKSLVHELGCDVIDLGIGHDDKQELKTKLEHGLNADILLTSGGVSVGKFDFVLETLKELGVEEKFWKVNIKPGMPLFFGIYNEKPVFGLPGNPVSSFVTFVEFVKPAILQMSGNNMTNYRVQIRATLNNEILKKDAKRHFVRGVLENMNGNFSVKTTGTQSSGVLTSLTKANCLIHLPEEKKMFQIGEIVEVELL